MSPRRRPCVEPQPHDHAQQDSNPVPGGRNRLPFGTAPCGGRRSLVSVQEHVDAALDDRRSDPAQQRDSQIQAQAQQGAGVERRQQIGAAFGDGKMDTLISDVSQTQVEDAEAGQAQIGKVNTMFTSVADYIMAVSQIKDGMSSSLGKWENEVLPATRKILDDRNWSSGDLLSTEVERNRQQVATALEDDVAGGDIDRRSRVGNQKLLRSRFQVEQGHLRRSR